MINHAIVGWWRNEIGRITRSCSWTDKRTMNQSSAHAQTAKKKKRYPCQDRSRLQNFNPPDWRMDPSTVAVLSRNASLSRHKSQKSIICPRNVNWRGVFFSCEELERCLTSRIVLAHVHRSNTSHWKSGTVGVFDKSRALFRQQRIRVGWTHTTDRIDPDDHL